MLRLPAAIVAGVLAFGTFAPQPALADWRYRGHGYQHHHRHHGGAAVLGGALLGLGIGAALGAALAPPAVIYAPPPVVYYEPPPPVAYYQPPPVHWAPPAYVPHYVVPAPSYALPSHDGGWK
ncbi:hypothetical protein [Falsiroseomonas sp. E2-1-a4]|uniref:hypothetical protein n=1 Tax=Falsiroseomonas sp. E2-1-a4 TaxID=3239299 RepID=UPI003F31A70E